LDLSPIDAALSRPAGETGAQAGESMTNADIVISLLTEMTGLPASTFEMTLDAARVLSPQAELDAEVPPEEAQQRMAKLRAWISEKYGGLNAGK
jgi:hypothetical protein